MAIEDEILHTVFITVSCFQCMHVCVCVFGARAKAVPENRHDQHGQLHFNSVLIVKTLYEGKSIWFYSVFRECVRASECVCVCDFPY